MAWLKRRKGSAYWEKMGLLHLAIEVLTGEQIAFNDPDIIKKSEGEVLVGDAKKIVDVHITAENQFQFALYSPGEKRVWYIANFKASGFVEVVNRYDPNQPDIRICITGSSRDDRQGPQIY